MFREEDGHLIGANDLIEVTFDGRTGGIRRLRNQHLDHDIIHQESPVPFRLRAQGSQGRLFLEPRADTFTTNDPTPSAFEFSIDTDAATAQLRWTTDTEGMILEVNAHISPSGGLELWPTLQVPPETSPPTSVTYPILESPKPFSNNGNDRLAFPGHAGWLIASPLQVEPIEAPYPDGYVGATLQCMAYYEQGRGGIYLASHDPYSTAKRLRFSADEMSFEHENWDLRSGQSIAFCYPIVIAPLTVGDWYEATDRYREWALATAPWCTGRAPNAVAQEKDGGRWLFDQVGLSVWCAPSSIDWAQWYRHYAAVAGTPLHVVPGWDWPRMLPPSHGYEGVFPATFHPKNRAAWDGHYVTPYLNDLFLSVRAPEFFERWESTLLFPYVPFPWAPFSEPPTGWVDGTADDADPRTTTNVDFFICPVTEEQQNLHAWRDLTLARDYELDGVFYDISSGNPYKWSRCLRTEHGHPPGRGRTIIDGYERLNRRSKVDVASETGRYFVQGTETIVENIIGSVDFYVSRAVAGPMGRLETDYFGPEEAPGGQRTLIPMFQAVYHDVGPVHEDGWITLSKAEGSLFFFVAARIALVWGGILSLQYSTVPPEETDDRDHSIPAETVLWDGSRHRWEHFPEADPSKIAFVGELAAARTTFARPYLAYGKMLRPPQIDVAQVELDFHQTFYGWGSENWHNDGSWSVPEVVVSAWLGIDGVVGIVLVNLRPDGDVDLHLNADIGSLWNSDHSDAEVSVRTTDGEMDLGRVSSANYLDLPMTLAPRRVTLVEIPAAK